MTYAEHVKQAEILLNRAENDLDTAQSQHEYRRVKQMVQMAQAHAQIAQAMRWARTS